MGVEHLTAEELWEVADDPEGIYAIHRHEGDHFSGDDCWCFPLCLSYYQITELSLDELQDMLDEHYRIH